MEFYVWAPIQWSNLRTLLSNKNRQRQVDPHLQPYLWDEWKQYKHKTNDPIWVRENQERRTRINEAIKVGVRNQNNRIGQWAEGIALK